MPRLSTRHWAAAALATLAVSASAFGMLGAALGPDTAATSAPDTPAPETPATHGVLDADGKPLVITPTDLFVDQPPDLAHTPPFPLEDGTLPSRSEAMGFSARYDRFIGRSDDGLAQLAAAGHLDGKGTLQDPYVLDRFYVDGDLVLESADTPLIIREGYVNGELRLNYVGERIYVHHVYARDLRVNENIDRAGPNTGGLFHDNHFGIVGQIRHYTGAFRDNQIGPIPEGAVRDFLSDTGAARLPEGVVFNFDGFHGADVHHNTFHGAVDVKIHGHNHGDCITCGIHHHDHEDEFPTDEGGEGHGAFHSHDLLEAGFRSKHSIRYHSLLFRDNAIVAAPDDRFGLRYNDRNHAGDDQTANSEPNPYLEDNHVHFQDVTFRANRIEGAPFIVDVYSADDERHIMANDGVLRIEDNRIVIPYDRGTSRGPLRYGMSLSEADDITLRVIGNHIIFRDTTQSAPGATLRQAILLAPPLAGFILDGFTAGDLRIAGNVVNAGDWGVIAQRFDDGVYWELDENRFDTKETYRARDTATGPGERPEAKGDDAEGST